MSKTRVTLVLGAAQPVQVGDLQLWLLDLVEAAEERDGHVEHVHVAELRATLGAQTQRVELSGHAVVFGHTLQMYRPGDSDVVLDVSLP
jgi:hypothetical protein